MKKYSLSVILPTYNERGNIILLIKKIIQQCDKITSQLEIIVVDDNSPDGTADEIKKIFKKNKSVKLFVRTKKHGLATAIWYGIRRTQYQLVAVMDTDFNHDPKELGAMLSCMNQFDFVIGSRYISTGGMENKLRHWLSYGFNLYLRILLMHGVHDNLSGFFMTRRTLLNRFINEKYFFGFGDYFIRIIYQLHKHELSIKEVPVYYKNRTYGTSKSKFVPMFISYTKTALQLRYNS